MRMKKMKSIIALIVIAIMITPILQASVCSNAYAKGKVIKVTTKNTVKRALINAMISSMEKRNQEK